MVSLGLLSSPNSNREHAILSKGVPADDEFKRIDKLPRRVWTKQQALRAVREKTAELRTNRGERVLWPDQAIALSEIEWYGGIVGGIRVSGGKTTVSFLAATLLEDLPRPLLIAPSKSIKSGKVARAYEEESKHWRIRTDYSWISYHDLQARRNADYLFNLRPGLIILDEAHHAGRYDSSRTKRIRRFLKEYTDTPVIVLTGSLIASRVVNDSLTLCNWARGAYSPLPHPTAKTTQRFWKLALDIPHRTSPGVLRRWCKPNEPTLAGVGRRYTSTPGVVCSAGENVVGTALSCSTTVIRTLEPAVLKAFDYLRNGRACDGGELLETDGSNTWLTSQTLALGFYYVYDPKPPTDWLDAYRNWCAYCREHISDEGCTCDTEQQVREHVSASADECWPWEDWQLVSTKYDYRFKRKAVWLSRARIRAARKWMDAHPSGLAWTQFPAFGHALALESGRPYYGSQARDRRTGHYITEHVKGSPAVASIKVCSEDLNLQYAFHENLFVSPPATGAWHEQAIARTHRYGQPEPEVIVEYWIGCAEQRDALSVALAREKAAAQLLQDNSRKMLLAEWSRASLTKLEGPQWNSKKLTKELMV